MTIEIMTLITVISITLGIVSTLMNLRKTSKDEAKSTIIETANLNNKIDNVLIGISELKVKLNAMEADQKDSRERIIILEQKIKTLFETVGQIQEHTGLKWGHVKLLVNDIRIKASYKDGSFYKLDGQKIDESTIEKIIMDYQEFKDFVQVQPTAEKKTKKKKDE